MKNTISVIIPVYIKTYLDRCIESVINQTYTNLQIVLVDDGSTDGSIDICKKWVAKDKRVVLIHKENGGAGSARNVGIKYALKNNYDGYITFVDGDDCMEYDGLEIMMNLIHKYDSDIVWGNHYVKKNTSTKSEVHIAFEDKLMTNYEILMNDDLRIFYSLVWGKLYKTKLWKNILMPENMVYYEDGATLFKVIYKAEKIYVTDKKVINYYLSDEGITRTQATEKMCRDAIFTQTEKIEFYKKNNEKKLLQIATVGLCNDVLKCIVWSKQFCDENSPYFKGLIKLYRRYALKTINAKVGVKSKIRFLIYYIFPKKVLRNIK